KEAGVFLMGYYLSVDGGGSKTAYLITDQLGKVLCSYVTQGCTFSVMGKEMVCKILSEGAEAIVQMAGISPDDLVYAVWGISCFGEYEEMDRYLSAKLAKLFPCMAYFCNDVEIGLAGSLLLHFGIHVVAGTGAIVMGRDQKGRTARSNGWHEDFSDEGSGYWLGLGTLSLFAKQADLREERSFLYEQMRKQYGFLSDMDIICFYQEKLRGKRKETAALQELLLKAAKSGDESAARLYESAAAELAQSVKGVARQLGLMEEKTPVSYCGGIFRCGAFILDPFSKYLRQMGFVLRPPRLSPLGGGILLAAEKSGQQTDEMVTNLSQYEQGLGSLL
ncbi:MAG: hypothetical protein K2G39_02140, partial [Lachnospiraceae bacterium]|nr:hypothetical protein [Lachnospiraceae bacterium]